MDTGGDRAAFETDDVQRLYRSCGVGAFGFQPDPPQSRRICANHKGVVRKGMYVFKSDGRVML